MKKKKEKLLQRCQTLLPKAAVWPLGHNRKKFQILMWLIGVTFLQGPSVYLYESIC